MKNSRSFLHRFAPILPTRGSGLLDGLESYWKLNEATGEDRIDWHGDNNLVDIGGNIPPIEGKLGAAAWFTAGKYLQIADQAELRNTGNFTIATWVYLNSKASTQIFVAKEDISGGQRDYALGYDAGVDRLFIRIVESPNGASATVNATSLGAPTTGQWYFIVAYRSGSTIGISVDDGTRDEDTFAFATVGSTAPFSIGGGANGASTMPDGYVDDTGFWSRALTEAEQSELFASGGDGLQYPFNGSEPLPSMLSGIVAYWPMDEESGQLRADLINSLHLDPFNAPGTLAGKLGDATEFVRASSQHVGRVSDPLLAISGNFTYTCWVWLVSKPATMVIIGKNTASYNEHLLWYNVSLDRYEFFLGQPPTGSPSRLQAANTFGSPPTGAWHFIAVRLSGSTLSISVNAGAADGGTYSGSNPGTGLDPFDIGRRSYAANFDYLDGYVDDVARWNRYLTDNEIVRLYNAGAGLAYPFA